MTDLSTDDAIDRDLLLGELAAARFAETDLREDAWNPLDWVYLVGDGLFTLNAREFAPLADRLTSTAGRLERLPSVLDAARDALVGHAGRPVGRFQTETAINQAPGIHDLITEALDAAAAAAPTDPAVAAIVPRLTAAADDGSCRDGGVRDASSRCRPAGERGRGSARDRAVHREDAAHDALRDADAGAHPGRRGTGVRRGQGRDDPAGPRRVAHVAAGRAGPRR